jgi:hypothetical protein
MEGSGEFSDAELDEFEESVEDHGPRGKKVPIYAYMHTYYIL